MSEEASSQEHHSGGEGNPSQPDELEQTLDALDAELPTTPHDDVIPLINAGCRPGCAILLVVLAGIAAAAIASFGFISNFIFGDGGRGTSGATPTHAESEQVAVDAVETGTVAEGDTDFLPRPGTWEIENLPFLPECGPGSLGSGFQEGTIEVLDDGAFIIATGQPGTASFELVLIDAAPGRLEYLGVEPITGIEMTMVFTLPTELQATIRNGGEICMERPAVGTWDREIGEPDPDAEEDEPLPDWMPADFPASASGEVNTIEEATSKTVIVVVADTHPTDVLLSIAEWAVEKGHPIIERSSTTLTIQLPENQLMYVEVVDIGNFNTQLTVTIEET